MRQSRILDFLREVGREWRDDDALIQGAALAYYALFAMAPLLVLIIAVAGLVLGRAAAQGRLVDEIQGLMGPDGARMVEGMVEHVSSPGSGIIATVVSLATMLFGASGVFGQLQAALNQIWGVTAGRAPGQQMRGSAGSPAPPLSQLDDRERHLQRAGRV